jgi:hypothetical protein
MGAFTDKISGKATQLEGELSGTNVLVADPHDRHREPR